MADFTVDATLYPFAQNFATIGGHQMHYVDEGSGDPIVMVHGNPTWSFYYRDIIKALRGEFRCIAPDHIGCGYSDKPDDATYAYTLEQRIADLTALLDHLDVRQNVTLIVHDWGGMIGMGWAVNHIERIKKIIILNTAAFPLPESKSFPWQLALSRTPIGTVLIRGFNAFSGMAARVGTTHKTLPKNVSAGLTAPYNSWANRIATLRFVQDIPLKPTDSGYKIVASAAEKLHHFANHPVQIYWGLKDFVFDKHFLAEWKRYLPNADVTEYADGGHYILEDYSEEIVPRIVTFVKQTT